MKKLLKNLALVAVAALSAVSCAESGIEEDIAPIAQGVTLYAETPNQGSTKIDFTDQDEEGIFLEWEAGDKFWLYKISGNDQEYICSFTTEEGDGKFTSYYENLRLSEGSTYIAKFNKDVDLSNQNGDDFQNLNDACQMEAQFVYRDDIILQFEHTCAIVTFKFKSSEKPAKLVFSNGDAVSYNVHYDNIKSVGGVYTSHIMVKPCAAVKRNLTFALYNSAGVMYDIRTVETSKAHEAGKRYTAVTSGLPTVSWEGAGTLQDPYRIENGAQLRLLSSKVNAGENFDSNYFELTSDINLGGEANEFTAIGTPDCDFKGCFNGAGYEVSGLYINKPDADYQGLFGCIDYVQVYNLGVSGEVIGHNYVGGVVGFLNNSSWLDMSVVYNCYYSGSVKGEQYVGGIVGSSDVWSQIYNCWQDGVVDATKSFGGITGVSWNAIINNCYCNYNLDVIGETAITNQSGLSGYSSGALHSQCLVDMLNNVVCRKNGEGISIKLCAWSHEQGQLPKFARGATAKKVDFNAINNCTYYGKGNSSDPYCIVSAAQLRDLSNDVNGGYGYDNRCFYMMTDIDLGGIDDNGNGVPANEFTAIGKKDAPFGGDFDGGGHRVSGLYINKPSVDYQGLFGYLKYGMINNLGVSGSVVGLSYVGGVVGKMLNSSMYSCYNKANVKGANTGDLIGGLIGDINGEGAIQNCYNTGSVEGESQIGGLVGHLHVLYGMKNCYNIGNVWASGTYVGGVAGATDNSLMSNCYNVGSVSKRKDSSSMGGITGWNSLYGKIIDCGYDSSVYTGAVCEENDGAITNCIGSTTLKTDMTNGTFAAKLGFSWKEDTKNVNNGYPIPASQQ